MDGEKLAAYRRVLKQKAEIESTKESHFKSFCLALQRKSENMRNQRFSKVESNRTIFFTQYPSPPPMWL